MEVTSLHVVSQYAYAVRSVGVCMSAYDWLRHSSGAHVLVLMLNSSSTIKLFSKSSCGKLFINIYIFEYVGDSISLQFPNDF